MTQKSYEVLEEFRPSKHKIRLTRTERKCINLLKKGNVFEPKNLIDDNVNYLTAPMTRDKRHATSCMVFKTLKIAKELGILKEVSDKPYSFEEFCNLESVSYFASQLRGSKNRNLKETRKIVSTKKDYLYRLWEFNNWLHGKAFDFKVEKHLSETTFEIKTEKITLENVEHFLELFKQPHSNDSDYIKIIKRFLNDEMHVKCSVGYMKLKHVSILAFFEKNECELRFKYDPNINHQDYSEESSNALLTLDDLGDMIRNGGASPLDNAVVLCKFQRGLDNTTMIDRFNFQVWEQLVNYFGSEIYESWDLKKCPVPIKLTRVKTNYTHTGYLDYDAIDAIQKYLKIRYTKTGEIMQVGQPLFLNSRNQPIGYFWISSVIPRLAKNAGIQKKIKNGELTSRNEKTSHELRDLLKSTLVVNGVASYVCELAIGHKIGDSYEKMDKLYPDKSRIEYAKASIQLNIVSKMKSSISEDYNTIAELRAKVDEITNSNLRASKGAREIFGETIGRQNMIIDSLQKSIEHMSKKIEKLEEKEN